MVVLATALGATPVRAQQGSQPAPLKPDAAARADDLFKAGMSDVKQQKWAEAEVKFQAALELNRSYDVAANLGQTQYRLGKYRDAAEHLSFAVRNWPLIGKKEPRELAAKRLAELRKLVGTVTIQVSVPGATVLVDGKEVGQSPLADEVFVDPGPRTVEARLSGYQSAKQAIEAAKGSAQNVSLTLAPIVAKPGGGDAANGGAHAGGAGTPGAGRETNPEGSTGASSGPRTALIVTGISATALAVVGGIAFAAVSNARASEAEEQRALLVQKGGAQPCLKTELAKECADVNSSFEARDAFGNAAAWSFITGGVLGAATVVYAVMTPKSAVRAAPMVGPSVGGVVVTGAW
jgi:hypothetical protein